MKGDHTSLDIDGNLMLGDGNKSDRVVIFFCTASDLEKEGEGSSIRGGTFIVFFFKVDKNTFSVWKASLDQDRTENIHRLLTCSCSLTTESGLLHTIPLQIG